MIRRLIQWLKGRRWVEVTNPWGNSVRLRYFRGCRECNRCLYGLNDPNPVRYTNALIDLWSHIRGEHA